MEGYLYALYNPIFQGPITDTYLLKIGMTTKDPWTRAKELFTTGLPQPFHVVWYEQRGNVAWYEERLHRQLALHRFARNREFFVLNEDYHDFLNKQLLECDECFEFCKSLYPDLIGTVSG